MESRYLERGSRGMKQMGLLRTLGHRLESDLQVHCCRNVSHREMVMALMLVWSSDLNCLI